MNIRKIKETDYENIYTLVKTAFETAKTADGGEQDYIPRSRGRSTYLPDLEFVAEDESGLIGHIMLIEQPIKTGKEDFTGVLVAILSVKLAYRNKGIGKALIEHGHKEALAKGYTAAFLAGDPNYYKRFGYRKTSDFGIKNMTKLPDEIVLPEGINPDDSIQSSELLPDALKDIFGTIEIEI